MDGGTVVVRLDSLGDLLVLRPGDPGRGGEPPGDAALWPGRCGGGAAAAGRLRGACLGLPVDRGGPAAGVRRCDRRAGDSAARGISRRCGDLDLVPPERVADRAGIAHGRDRADHRDQRGLRRDVARPTPRPAGRRARAGTDARCRAGRRLQAAGQGPWGARGPDRSASDASAIVGPAAGPYLVVHPGATAPARRYPAESWCEVVRLLTGRGRHVLVTGSAAETELTARVTAAAVGPGTARDCGGQLSLIELASVLRHAAALAAANTGPAHLAAAVRTPVVSLFAPVVPAARWAPYGEHLLLGDQSAPCSDTRVRVCPVPAHPCLASVPPRRVVDALEYYLARAGSPTGRAAVPA